MFLPTSGGAVALQYEQKEFLNNITVTVQLANGKNLPLKGTGQSAEALHFAGEGAVAALTVSEQSGVLALCISGHLQRDRSKGRFFDSAEQNLSEKAAVTVAFSAPVGLEAYHSLYSIGFWNKPGAYGRDLAQLQPKTQSVTLKYKTDYGFLLTACSEQYKSQLSGTKGGGLAVSLCSCKRGMTAFSGLLFVFGRSQNAFALPEKLTAAALKLLNKPGLPLKSRQYPKALEYLGWCSWDAFPCCPSHEGILQKLQELKEKNIPVKWLIIDDMWQQLDGEDSPEVMHDRKLVSWQPNKARFPGGLKQTVQAAHRQGLQVGVWHPVTGYWYGFDENSPLVRQNPNWFCKTEDGRTVIRPTAEAFFSYHAALYRYLSSCGVDFIKADNQSCIEWFYKNLTTAGEAAQALHTGLEGAAGAYFNGALINCMGCAAENLWNRPVSLVNRCSNDFLPENRKWFAQHILQACYSCYSFSGLFLGDFDMFWTDDGQAVKNCVVRAMSGGPIYVSDPVGRSVAERLLPLCFEDGRIIRCNRNAMPTADCLTDSCEQGPNAFKIWSSTENSLIMAAFNITEQETPVTAKLSPANTLAGTNGEYLVFDYFAQTACLLPAGGAVFASLPGYDDFKFLSFVPVQNGRAVVGLVNKYIAGGTFRQLTPNGYLVYGAGPFAFYSKVKPKNILQNGCKAPCKKQGELYIIEVTSPNSFVEINC